MKLEIAGMGGGSGVEITGTFGRDYEAEECLEMVVPAKLQLQVGKFAVNGKVLTAGTRAKVYDVKPLKKKLRAVPAESDLCEKALTEINDLPQMDALDQTEATPGGAYWETLTMKREVTGQVAVGLKLAGQVPVSFGIDYKRVSSDQTTISTMLTPGANYVAYAPSRTAASLDEQLEICWTTQT